MPRRALRSRSLARTRIHMPGGGTKIQYRRKQPSVATCATCERPLPGVPRTRRGGMAKLAKTEKRPERPFGGKLCSPCMRAQMVVRARSL